MNSFRMKNESKAIFLFDKVALKISVKILQNWAKIEKKSFYFFGIFFEEWKFSAFFFSLFFVGKNDSWKWYKIWYPAELTLFYLFLIRYFGVKRLWFSNLDSQTSLKLIPFKLYKLQLYDIIVVLSSLSTAWGHAWYSARGPKRNFC